MSTDTIELWHKRARPEPTERDFDVQLGCHFEEISEMLDSLEFTMDGVEYEAFNLRTAVRNISLLLKNGEVQAEVSKRKDFADSVGDQVVTVIGAAYCAGMKPNEIIRRVNLSNWTKFNSDGFPEFDKNGKISKPSSYVQPDLEGTY